VPRARWPKGARRGDFIELPLSSWGDLQHNPIAGFFDPASVAAVRHFFVNGGVDCVLFGVCIEGEQDLRSDDPFDTCFHALIERLRGEDDLGILLIPILAYLPASIGRDGNVEAPGQVTLELFLKHCAEMTNRFLIVDPPRDLHDKPLFNWVADLRSRNESSACHMALYYPWLQNGDDVFPPSGAIAGLYARLDREHEPFGVRWPPANRPLQGVTHPSVGVPWREISPYVDAHINLALTQPARGVIVWGARTLSAEPRWRHINSRRVVSLIREQLRRDSRWVVFENQGPELWEILKRQVRVRLDQLWDAGLLENGEAGLNYLVRCDKETNPVEKRDAGQVNIEVTIRPISTAEFIVMELRLGS